MRLQALVTAFILAGSPGLATAEPISTPPGGCATDAPGAAAGPACAAPAERARRSVIILAPSPAMPGDIHGARGPDPHARELREIALADSVGNHEKALIGARQLAKFGVTREAVQDAIDGAHLHTGNLRAAKRRFFVIEQGQPDVEPGWENSQ